MIIHLIIGLIKKILNEISLYKNESIFALKTNLDSIKTEVDKFDINKLVPVPVGLIK